MKIFIDFETRSACDLKKAGAYRYAEDPTTDVLCLAVKIDDDEPALWVPEKFRHLREGTHGELIEYLAKVGTEIHAHNANFERCIWREVMVKRYGFPDIPLEKWRCTAAKAAAMNIPRHLDGACEVMGLPAKDKAGYSIMLRMCKPRKPRKAEREADPGWESKLWWHETPEDFAANCKYCLNDVEIEAALDAALPDLSDDELAVWQLDQRINDRGVQVDLESVEVILADVEAYKKKLTSEVSRLTNRQVTSPSKVKDLLTWLRTRGLEIPDVQLGTINRYLDNVDMTREVRRALEIRASWSKATSCAKYDAMQRAACSDGRVHGMLLYYGAQATGRWSGRLVQLQNLPRGDLKFEQIQQYLWGVESLGSLMAEDVLDAASSCVRSVLTAGPGRDFVCSDFANIEGRAQAWLAGEQWKLKAFREYDHGIGPDLYKLAYSRAFGIEVDSVSKDERQVGKVMELALGYSGGIAAFAAMANNYSLNLDDLGDMVLPKATQEERERSEWIAEKYIKRAKQAVAQGWKNAQEPPSFYACVACDLLKTWWRAAHPFIVSTWSAVEKAAILTVNTGQAHAAGPLTFGQRSDFLHMRLPSGRLLSMKDPEVVEGEYGGEQLTFWGMNTMTNKWTRKRTYGGDLFQSAIQAIARDIMAEAMLRVETAGYECVMTVHDEIVAEGDGLEMFEGLMGQVPAWAEGMPIAVDGWQGFRYRKG